MILEKLHFSVKNAFCKMLITNMASSLMNGSLIIKAQRKEGKSFLILNDERDRHKQL
jgi:hypothetical protein